MKYRRKHIYVEAFKYCGTGCHMPEWAEEALRDNKMYYDKHDRLIIKAFNEEYLVNEGDYIVKELLGEIYPLDSNIFECIYRKVPRYGII